MVEGGDAVMNDELTIAGLHGALRRNDLSCLEVVDFYLERIEKYDRLGPAINAVINVNPDAKDTARRMDESYRPDGDVLPLFGVPLLLKDNVNTFDMPTTAGSLVFENLRPSRDAHIVEKLRSAGALILAKVNLSEFACTGETLGSLIGQTKNPYDLTHTPGGSSGGTGAGLAANFGLAGIGTDTVNSVRSPASACNIVGIRPTRGLVSRSGLVPYSLSMDTAGPLARTVEDAARVLEVIAGYDANDPVTAWCIDRVSAYADPGVLGADNLRGVRIGLVRSMTGTESVHAEVNGLTEAAVRILLDLGAQVVDYEGKINPAKLLSDVNIQFYEQDADITAYLKNLGDRSPAPDFQTLLATGKIAPWVAVKMEKAIPCGRDQQERDARLLKMAIVRDEVMRVMAHQNLDALLYPMQQRLVAKIGDPQFDRNGVLAAVTGFPAITVPGGFSHPAETAPLGIPVGIEFFGRPWSERTLIKIAHVYEQATRHRRTPLSTPLNREG